jgi:molybdopterin molybdotransferase
MATIPVAAALRVAILATGSELRQAGASAGGIYDSNGPMLAALLGAPGVEVTTATVDDGPGAVMEALQALAGTADLVITTAGMADGSRDHVRAAVERAGGRLELVRVAMKPGKPLALGRLGDAAFVGLPGNPQAAAFAALAFIRPMIAALLGAPLPGRLTARLGFACRPRTGRTELVPVRLASDAASLVAHRAGAEGSHRLLPMAGADAVAILPGSAHPIAAGTPVEVLPFDRLRFER